MKYVIIGSGGAGVPAIEEIRSLDLLCGKAMYRPGALNATPGNVLDGVSSHAEIAGNCKACHAAPWQAPISVNGCTTTAGQVSAFALQFFSLTRWIS